MHVSDIDADLLRRLAQTRPEQGLVVSVYLDLDPSNFATPPARETAIRSLLDEAERKSRQQGLSHAARTALKDDLGRVGELLRGDLPAGGARSVAVFASREARLFEAVRLPRPVESGVFLERSPVIEPVADMAARGRWCVVLVSRRSGRILRGSAESLAEVGSVVDDVHGQHDQGGYSQPRYGRSIEKEVDDHLRRAADVLFRRFKRVPFDHLVVGGPQEIVPAFETALHPYLRERLAGRIDVDVDNSSPERVLEAARPLLEEHERRREREALDRLAEGAGRSDGRGAAGLGDVLAAINERRVETLLLDESFSAPGVACPQCGWLGDADTDRCPADGSAIQRREDVTEEAVERVLAQSADVIAVRHHDDLERVGGIGAVLRF